jgi:hypothetical protein
VSANITGFSNHFYYFKGIIVDFVLDFIYFFD